VPIAVVEPAAWGVKRGARLTSRVRVERDELHVDDSDDFFGLRRRYEGPLMLAVEQDGRRAIFSALP
jgi:hypothetical protein